MLMNCLLSINPLFATKSSRPIGLRYVLHI